jgi:quercetin dioxygenase-like cupin family protein
MAWQHSELRALSALRMLTNNAELLMRARVSLGLVGDDDRRWVELGATTDFDAWLIGWGPASAIPAHDHAASAAAIQVVQGALVEWSRPRCTPDPWSVRTIEVGAPAVVPRNRVHRIGNDAACTAVSVHVYSPPLTEMTFHDELERAITGASFV